MADNTGKYAGMKIPQAREQIVKDLYALGLIEKEEDYIHNIQICERCGNQIEHLNLQSMVDENEGSCRQGLKRIRK